MMSNAAPNMRVQIIGLNLCFQLFCVYTQDMELLDHMVTEWLIFCEEYLRDLKPINLLEKRDIYLLPPACRVVWCVRCQRKGSAGA